MSSNRIEDFSLEDYLPYWLSPDDLIAGLAALAVTIAFIAIWQALRPRDPFSRRFAQVSQRRENLRQAALDSKRRGRQRLTAAGLMRDIVTKLNLLRSQRAVEARTLLAQAGLRSNEAMIRYLFARLAMPFVFGAVVLADSYGAQVLPVPERLRTIAALGAAVLGFFAPDVFIKNLIKKRAHQIEFGLPDALDLLVICAEAGLSLDASLIRVSRELEFTWPELSEEFGITAAELTYLPDRKGAFDNLNARTNMPGIRGVVNTLLQTAKFGTPLAQSLRILAAEFRDARLIRAEEKAARLPAMLTVPMILFILPTLFIVLLGPAALSIMDTFSKKGAGTASAASTRTAGRGSEDSPLGGGGAIEEAPGAPVKTVERMPKEELPSEAFVRPARPTVPVGDLLVVDVDARALRAGSSHRVLLVPSNSPDAVDTRVLALNSAPVVPDRVRVSLPAREAGAGEVRLYYTPPGSSDFAVAARAPVSITP